MCKETLEEKSYFQKLKANLTLIMNGRLAEYNKVRPVIESVAAQNTAHRGAFIEGPMSAITNRINGAYAFYNSPIAFYNAGLSGWHWANYFSRCPNLEQDVTKAGMKAIYGHLWPPSFTGLATVTVTAYDATSGGMNELAQLSKIRYEQQRDTLIVSVGTGMGVTQVLKHVGNTVNTDIKRRLIKGAMRSWQLSSLMGLCYGLSRLHEGMKETGVFHTNLVERRDKFIQGNSDPNETQFNTSMKDAVVSRKT